MRYLPHLAVLALILLGYIAIFHGLGAMAGIILFALIAAMPLFAFAFAISSIVLLFIDVDVPLSERVFRPRIMSGVLCALIVAASASLPWILAFAGDFETSRIWFWASVVILAPLFFVAMRSLPLSWAFVTSPSVLLLCVWVAVISVTIAKQLGWQDLTWEGIPEDADSGLVGDGFGMVLWFAFGSVLALVVGPVIGLLSQIGKRRAVA